MCVHVCCTQVTLTQFSQFAAGVENTKLPCSRRVSGLLHAVIFPASWPTITLFTTRVNVQHDEHIFLGRANKMLYHRAFAPAAAGRRRRFHPASLQPRK